MRVDGEDEDEVPDDDNEVRLVMGSRHEHTAGAVTKGMWRPRVRKPDNAMHCVALDSISNPSALQQYIRFYIAVHYIIALHLV